MSAGTASAADVTVIDETGLRNNLGGTGTANAGDTIKVVDPIIMPAGHTQMDVKLQNLTLTGNVDGSAEITAGVTGIMNAVADKKAQGLEALTEWMKPSTPGKSDFTVYVKGLINDASTGIIAEANLIKIIANPSTDNALFYNNGGQGNGLNLANLHITMGSSSKFNYTVGIGGGGLLEANHSTSDGSPTVATIGNVSSSIFSGITVEATNGDLYGSGLLGAYAYSFSSSANSDAATASLGQVSGSSFSGITVEVTGGNLTGGGLLGAFAQSISLMGSSGRAEASLGQVSGSIFSGITVEADDGLTGGGLLGAYAYSAGSTSGRAEASIGQVSDSIFSGITVKATNDALYGGGLLGAYANSDAATANVGQVSFSGITVEVGGSLNGGGLLGAYAFSFGIMGSSGRAEASLGQVSDSIFSGITVEAGGDLNGGGLLGAVAVSQGGTTSDAVEASLGQVSDSIFSGITVKATNGGLTGGGLLGAYAYSLGGTTSGPAKASLGQVSGSSFSKISVEAGNLVGGGVIGVLGNNLANAASLGKISDSEFTGVKVTASVGDVLAGLIYAGGLDQALVIENSRFQDNKATASGTVYAGALGIDTSYATNNSKGHEVTLTAEAGRSTVFQNNLINSGGAANSIYMGNFGSGNPAQADAVLNIQARAGGLVALADPLKIEQGGEKFTLNIGGAGFSGDFHWGGVNKIKAGNGSALNFLGESRSTLLPGFQVENQGSLAVDLAEASTLMVELGADPSQAPVIEADQVKIASGASIGLAEAGSFSYTDPGLLAAHEGQAVLSFDTPDRQGQGRLEEGAISIGVFDHHYQLAWNGDQVILGQAGTTYNKTLGAGEATRGPGAMGADLLNALPLFDHLRRALDLGRLQPAYGQGDSGFGLWLSPGFTHTRYSGDRAYDLDTLGTSLGWDYRPEGRDLVFGLALSFFDQDYDSRRTELEGRTFLAQAYAGAALPQNFEAFFSLGLGRSDYEQSRQVYGQRLKSDYEADLFSLGLELARPFELSPSLSLRPFLSYDYLHLAVNGYRERGGNGIYNIRTRGYDQDLHRFRAGAGLDWEAPESGVQLGLKAWYQGLGGDRDPRNNFRFTGDPSGTKWVSLADPLDDQGFGLALSAAVPLGDWVSLGAGYQLGLAEDTQSHQGRLTLRVDF